MRRVLVVGPCGAGKSTLAMALADITGLPLHHMDRLHWSPGWVEGTREQLVARLEPILTGDRWIIDGNYSGTLPLRLARADTVVFLDYRPRIYRARVVRRMLLARWRKRPDMADGCRERFDGEFLRYVWRFHHDTRPRVLEHLCTLRRDQDLIRLEHPRAAASFLACVRLRDRRGSSVAATIASGSRFQSSS